MEAKPLELKEIQRISLEVLKKITSICETQNFRYTLAYGTLIGAIRHKGFIPWDDDIDIQMPRPDYEKFIKYMVEHPIENLKVFNHKYVKNYPLGISRIADMRYKVEEKILEDCDMGIFVDVYPIDGLANTYDGAKEAYSLTDKPRANLLRMIYKKDNKIRFSQIFSDFNFFASGIKLEILGLSRVQMQLEKAAMSIPFESSGYVGIPNWNWIRLVYKREWYEDYIRVPFEDSEFFISKNYDGVLRAEYGDYMQLPPVEKRVFRHDYVAYKRK